MKNLNLYALANELNLGDPRSGTIRIPFGRWDFGAKKLDDGRTVFFVQELTKDGAERMAAKINAGVLGGEKGVPVYWGHPDVPELAHKYPDKRAKGWIKPDKKPALNPDLWEKLLALTEKHEMRYHWVKGHAENEYNNRCDALAVAARERFAGEDA